LGALACDDTLSMPCRCGVEADSLYRLPQDAIHPRFLVQTGIEFANMVVGKTEDVVFRSCAVKE